MLDRRTFLAGSAGAAMLPIAARAEAVDAFPSRPIRLIVPQAAGSGVDLQARLFGQKLGEMWGKQVVIEDRPGANAIIGTEYVAKSAPDGYTLVYAPVTSVTTNAFIYKKLPYDPLRDLAPITQTTMNPMGAIANPASGIKTIRDLVARAKAAPGKVNFGTFGIGNLTHLMGLLLSTAAGIEMTHVPYKGQTPEMTDVMSGQIQGMFDNVTSSFELVRSTKLRALGVTTPERSETMPEVPPIGDTLAGFETSSFYGVGAPHGTPREIVDLLNREINETLADPTIRLRLGELGAIPIAGNAGQFGTMLNAETERWRRVVEMSGQKKE